jgi:hypothetical protein
MRPYLGTQAHGLIAAAGLAGQFQIIKRKNESLQPTANHGMIVNDQDPDAIRFGHTLSFLLCLRIVAFMVYHCQIKRIPSVH